MILFVHHRRDALVGEDEKAAKLAVVREVVADEMTLDQELAIERSQLAHFERERLRERRGLPDRREHARIHHDELLFARAMGERDPREISREADPRAQNHVRGRTRSVEPAAERGGESRQLQFPPPIARTSFSSSFLIRSRRPAADSKSSSSTAFWSSSCSLWTSRLKATRAASRTGAFPTCLVLPCTRRRSGRSCDRNVG